MSTTATFQVSGMTCGHCEMSVREEVSEIPGVQVDEVDHVLVTSGTGVPTSGLILGRE